MPYSNQCKRMLSNTGKCDTRRLLKVGLAYFITQFLKQIEMNILIQNLSSQGSLTLCNRERQI